jgi:hypothetical protein
VTEAATETGTTDTSAEDGAQSTSEETTEALGDAGKKALDAMKAKWKAAEAKAKANEDAAKRLADLEAASASETEKAVTAARKEGEAAAIERANARLVRAEARAVAAELGFIDPADALGQVDLSEIAVDEAGDVDSEAVRKELADLAERKKYLLKATRDTSGVDAGIGAAGEKPKPGTRAADLAQIEADLAAAARRR